MRAGGDSGLQDKVSFTVYTTGIQVATVLASGVHLEEERHTCTYSVNVGPYSAEKMLSPF